MKNNPKASLRYNVASLAVSGLFLVIAASLVPGPISTVHADQYDDQISALEQQNASAQSNLNTLTAQASSYKDAINKLQAQINALQANIDKNLATQADLKQQIIDAQNEIDKQRGILADDIRTMYVDGSPSTIEMLATSKNLSDFVDKQEYRSAVQSKLQATLKKISALQAQLKSQKAKVDELLKELQSQRGELSDAKAKQTSMLAYNQQQQAGYNAKISANQSKIADLRHQQYLANLALSAGGRVIAGDPSHGGYPAYLDNASQDSLVDPWGMYNRECVSYTAWKVQQTYGYMPYWGGTGNANQWPGDARAAGIPTGSTPRVHSVAIWNVGYYGHAMWVEAVNSDGSIWVSQYNYDYHGHYSEMLVSASMASSLTYIYFH